MCGCLSLSPQLGTWPATQACALTGVRSRALNSLSHTSQGPSDDFISHIFNVALLHFKEAEYLTPQELFLGEGILCYEKTP